MNIRRVDYFYATIEDQPGETYRLLAMLAKAGVNLLAFSSIPLGPLRTLLTIFPEDTSRMKSAARKGGLVLNGPHTALLVQGDDQLGALAGIHAKLRDAAVDVTASNAVSDGRGGFGYILYVNRNEYELAARSLAL